MNNLVRSIGALNRELSDRLHTANEFHEALEEIVQEQGNALAGLGYEIESGTQVADSATDSLQAMKVKIGVVSGDRSPDHSHVNNVDDMGTTCRTNIWWSNDTQNIVDSAKLIDQLFELFWGSQLRTDSAGIIDAKRSPEARRLANAAVTHHARNGRDVSVLFCDLDNFRQVNKTISQSEGDRVIRELGLLLQSMVFGEGLLLHMGGDEFSIILPNCGASGALLWAYRINKCISGHDFNIGDISLGLSTGIVCRNPSDNTTLQELLDNANEALKKVKAEMKGSARHWDNNNCEIDCTADHLNLSLCLVKCGVAVKHPFASPWLNVISELTRCAVRESPDIVSDAVTDFISWSAIDFIEEEKSVSWQIAESTSNCEAGISHIDVCMAVCHGIHSAMALDKIDVQGDLKIELLEQKNTIRLVSGGGVEYWSTTTKSATDRVIPLGPPFAIDSSWLDKWVSPAILIQIGHKGYGIPKNLFSAVITVDDRPTRGGGLPDFWEATVGRVCSHVANNSGCSVLYIVGNVEHATESVRRFRSVIDWDADRDYLSDKTGLPQAEIADAAKRLADRVEICDSSTDLVEHLAGLLVLPCSFQNSRLPGDRLTKQRIFKRNIDSSNIQLKDSDGCRVKTIADAYPVTIEIIRSSDDVNKVCDLAGQEFQELRNFQIVLSDGGRDPIPYYYRADEKSLAAYYDRNFMQVDGLFRSAMDEGLQLQNVIDHVVSSLQRSDESIATRRATIVLPYDTKIDEPEPLGLTSVNILPRKVDGEIEIHVSFTWRTVEALVGLPYSLYGSIRFSQELVHQIGAKLADVRLPRLGEVTYIAGSLHISVNESQQLIAKRIVDEASI